MAIASLVPGQVFAGEFVIERELAEGGMGVLYVALQRSTHKRRALKVMQPQLVSAKNPEQASKNQQRFLAEARIAGSIDSEHVVEVVSAGIDTETGAPWMVMELLEGRDLDAELKERGRLPPAELLGHLEQLCHALGAAHRAGVFHLDLKPANIFVARSRGARATTTIKVLDFGIARLVNDQKRSTTVTTAVGSPFWMSPEQATRGARVGGYTDVWAVGLIVFRALTGVHYWREANVPREEINVTGWLMEMMTSPLDPASVRAREFGVSETLPAGFDAWFARCVNRDVNARFANAQDCFTALAPMLTASTSQAPASAVDAVGPTMPITAPIPPTQIVQTPPPPVVPTRTAPSRSEASQPAWGMRLAAVGGVILLGLPGVALVWRLMRHEAPTAPRPEPVVSTADAGVQAREDVQAAVVREEVPLRVTQVTMGVAHACARTEEGRVLCWGGNRNGQLGDGTTTDRLRPTPVSGLDHVEKVVAGAFHTCVLRDDHTVWCWGENADGQLGDPSFTSSARWTPAVVPNLSEVTSLALGFGSTCVTSSGAVLCWGNNLHEVVAPSGSSVRSPRRREGLGYAIEVVSRWGANCVCAVMELEGFLRCWGYNGEGAFGDGTTRSSWAPVQAMGRRPRSVALGDYTTCTAEMNGDVYCFGSNGGHALGTGEDARRRSTPQRLAGLSGAVQVSAGRNSTCAVLSTGEVYCWGEWEGGMVRPDRQRSGTPTPSKLEGLADVVQMTGAYEDGCAVSRDHSLRCWGVNVSGTVGDGTTDFRPEVTLVLAP